jgi:hypothetical protein
MMADVPSSQESARAILKIFAAQNVRGGEILMAGAVNQAFLRDLKHRAEDYAAGLNYAIEKGWLIDEGNMIRLTETGFNEL